MKDFLENHQTNKTINIVNLDDFSIEDLKQYIKELRDEIYRVELEIKKKENLIKEAQKIFK